MKIGNHVIISNSKNICRQYHGATGRIKKIRQEIDRYGEKQPVMYSVRFTEFLPDYFSRKRSKVLWFEEKHFI